MVEGREIANEAGSAPCCLPFQVAKQVMGLCFPAEEGNGHQVTCLPWRP